MALATHELETETTGTNGTGDTELVKLTLEGSTKHPFTFNAPDALAQAIKDDAASRVLPDGTKGVNFGSVILGIVADHYNFDVVDNFGGRKRVTGLTKAEKAKIAKTKRDAQKDFMKELMAKALKGTLTPEAVTKALSDMAAKVQTG